MIPSYLAITTSNFIEAFKNDVVSISKGKYYDFSDNSLLSVLAEALALRVKASNEAQAKFLPFIKADLLESLGFVRLVGTNAVVTIRVLLNAKYSREFVIPEGTRFALTVGSYAVFETQTILKIPSNIDTADPLNYQYCSVDAIAIEQGEKGNQPTQKASMLQPIEGVEGFYTTVASKGGNDDESPEAFYSRVSLIVRKFLENQFSLVQPYEFEQAVSEILGFGSVAIAIPDIASDGTNTQLASMHVFALNPDTSSLTDAQRRNLLTTLSTRSPLVQGRLYFSSLRLIPVDIKVSIKVNTTANTEAILVDINKRLREMFSVKASLKMTTLEYYLAVHQVYLAGGEEVILTWRKDTDLFQGRNLPLDRVVSFRDESQPIKIRSVAITVEPNGITTEYTQ